jgi:tRNA threonylcarbamoyladenosine modification (KEOPS) complex Cgi121 subunit
MNFLTIKGANKLIKLLGVKPGEEVLIITDVNTVNVGQSLAVADSKVRAWTRATQSDSCCYAKS